MMNAGRDSYRGKRIKDYTILRKLGDGGCASVYLARSHDNKHVAIKLLDPKYLRAEGRQLFLQESQYLQELRYYQYILPILEYGESEGIPYIVSEYAPRGTLRERINAACSITLDEALKILVQVGRAIHIVHLHNIVHSDLKPENILFNEKGDAILSDFGIAIRLGSNEIFFGLPRGTYAYMAPEQFDGLFTKEGDQYALGCIGYELLTGKHPFEPFLPYDPQNREMMKERHKNAQVRFPSELNKEIPNSVGLALLRAMAKKSSERYTNIASFIHVLLSSTASSSQLSQHITAALQTPPPFSSIMKEASYPPSRPPDNRDVASINLEACYEMLQP